MKNGNGYSVAAFSLPKKSFRQAESNFETFKKAPKFIILMMKDTPDGFLSFYLPFRHRGVSADLRQSEAATDTPLPLFC